MNHPEGLKYSRSHEWVRVEEGTATIGITAFAQNELGDIVYLELPEVGRTLQREDVFGTVESVKAVSDLYAPVSGEVVAINEGLTETPEEINADPYEQGWMIRVRLSDPAELNDLLSATDYEQANG